MEIILLERIEKLGQMGDVVRVKPGHARNYLLPQKKALRATRDNLAYFETQRSRLEAENLEHRAEAESVAGKVEGLQIVVLRQAGESGQLFGSVTARDVTTALGEEEIKIDRRQVLLDHPIKTLGLHPIRLRLHPEVAAEITVNVARTADEAELQAAGRAVGAEADAEAEAAELAEIFDEVPDEITAEDAEDEAEGAAETAPATAENEKEPPAA